MSFTSPRTSASNAHWGWSLGNLGQVGRVSDLVIDLCNSIVLHASIPGNQVVGAHDVDGCVDSSVHGLLVRFVVVEMMVRLLFAVGCNGQAPSFVNVGVRYGTLLQHKV